MSRLHRDVYPYQRCTRRPHAHANAHTHTHTDTAQTEPVQGITPIIMAEDAIAAADAVSNSDVEGGEAKVSKNALKKQVNLSD